MNRCICCCYNDNTLHTLVAKQFGWTFSYREWPCEIHAIEARTKSEMFDTDPIMLQSRAVLYCLTGAIRMLKDEKKQWELQVDHSLFAIASLDVTVSLLGQKEQNTTHWNELMCTLNSHL